MMDFTYFMLSVAASLCAGTICAFLYRAIFRPSGWTKKDSYGVAVRFKVFLPLYLQKPEKWKLMPDKARYDDKMTVYFSSGLEWRKYNRWRKRAEKERMKRQQEERKQKFFDMIFQDYQPKPNPEFTPPPTVKPKDQRDKPTIIRRELQGRSTVTNLYDGICETVDDLQSEEAGRWAERSAIYCVATNKVYVKGSGEWREAVAEPKTEKGKLTDAECDKIRADLMLAAQAQEKQSNPRCKDCVHMRYRHNDNGKIDTVCVKHRTANGFEPIFPEMVACGVFEKRYAVKVERQPEPLGTVTTH